jgi:hypothetical protein
VKGRIAAVKQGDKPTFRSTPVLPGNGNAAFRRQTGTNRKALPAEASVPVPRKGVTRDAAMGLLCDGFSGRKWPDSLNTQFKSHALRHHQERL